MTDKEKARAYDEALERARANYKANKKMGFLENCDMLELIFPQLTESDDERIRKEMVDYFSQYKDDGIRGVDITPWIAYLEKQEIFSKNGAGCYYYDADGSYTFIGLPGFGPIEDIKLNGERPKTENKSVGLPGAGLCVEKQKEQKPILEVFDFKVGDAVRLKDGDGRKHIIKSFEEVEGLHGPNFYHVEFEDNLARDGIYPGEEYPNGYYTQMEKCEEEQKPAEWSDDFEENIRILLHDKLTWHSEDGSMSTAVLIDDKTLKDIISGIWFYVGKEALKYPNKELNVSEWSEEDEILRVRTINRLETLNFHGISGKEIRESIDWLKNLPERFNLQPKKELSIEKAIQWLDDTFYFLDNSSGRGRDCEITTHDFDSLEEMYDSFRKAVIVDSEPHWKPSEEQMKALKECGECKRCIKKLYEDLQKRYGTC